MQGQHELLGVSLVNSNVRNICRIETNNNNTDNYLVAPLKRKEKKRKNKRY